MFRIFRIKSKILSLLILSGQVAFSQTTNFSGVINSYVAVSAVNSNSVTVTSSAGFAAGNRVLLIQMKGASINTSNSSSYGSITSLNNAGNFEFYIISSVPNATRIVLATTPTVAFTAGGTNRVQLVKVASAPANANVNGNVTAAAWDGTIGGVIAIEVSGTLTILANRRIDASGQGFGGGLVSNVSNGTAWCNWSDFRSAAPTTACYDGIYAQKGEGITEDTGFDYGRGPQANGGGGSGEHNGGGAGGSNVSAGGDGGRQLTDCPYRRNGTGLNCNTPAGGAVQSNSCSTSAAATTTDVMVGGVGGVALTAGSVNKKIFMGGGGGGGQQNGAGGTSGADGGGIIIISATTIVNNSTFPDAIRANGNNASATTGNEGAGGGGGGGSILIETTSFANAITLAVAGGDGGNAVTSNTACRGPGGGGGGGLIWISGLTSAPANLTTDVTSGTAGSVVCSSAAACGGTPPSTNTLTCYGNTGYCAKTPTASGNVNTQLNIPLPIELTDFDSNCENDVTKIKWKVANEKKLDHYVVQRSIDASTWIDISNIYPSASSVFPKEYTSEDQNFNNNDVTYYRLSNVDTDGKKDHSRIITSNCKTKTSLEFGSYYNNGFILEFKTIPQKLTIYNAIGQLIALRTFDQNSTKSQYIQIDSELPSGMYVITVEYGDQVLSKKMVINK
jgi:hypothetical protein